jgi:hypothetical protein
LKENGMAGDEFEIEISPEGKVTIRTKGVKGGACLDYADLFAQIIGKQESRTLTHEYYETGQEVQQQVEQKVKR